MVITMLCMHFDRFTLAIVKIPKYDDIEKSFSIWGSLPDMRPSFGDGHQNIILGHQGNHERLTMYYKTLSSLAQRN